MNFVCDSQLLSSHVTFTDDKSLAGLDDQSWRRYLIQNLEFTTSECCLLVHRLCAIILDASSVSNYIKFLNAREMTPEIFQV